MLQKEVHKLKSEYTPLDEDDSGSDFAEKVERLNYNRKRLYGYEPFKCNRCSKEFDVKWELTRH